MIRLLIAWNVLLTVALIYLWWRVGTVIMGYANIRKIAQDGVEELARQVLTHVQKVL